MKPGANSTTFELQRASAFLHRRKKILIHKARNVISNVVIFLKLEVVELAPVFKPVACQVDLEDQANMIHLCTNALVYFSMLLNKV
jgi:hypothetical protein